MNEKIEDIIAAFEGMEIIETDKYVCRADNTNLFEFHVQQIHWSSSRDWEFYMRFCCDDPYYDKYFRSAKEAHEYLKSKQPDCDERYALCICKDLTGDTDIFTVNKEMFKLYNSGFRSMWIATTWSEIDGENFGYEQKFV